MSASHFKTLLLTAVSCLLFSACSSNKNLTSSNFKKKNTGEFSLRKSLIKEAEKHQGIPYKYAGKDPKGFDCSGFTYYVCSKYKIKLSGSSAYQSKQGSEINPR